MAATILSSVRLIKGGKSTQTQSGEDDVAVYQVEVLEDNATPFEVRRAIFPGLPNYDDPHPVEPTKLKVINRSAQRVGDKGKNHWEITVTWGNPAKDKNEWGDTPNSKNLTVRVSGQETPILTQLALDTASTPIRNAVGDLYPDPVETVLYDEVITVDYEAQTFNPNLVAALRGKINNNIVTLTLPQGNITWTRSFAARTLLLKTVDYSVTWSVSDPTQSVWNVNCVLIYRPDGWRKSLPEKGYRWKDEDGNLTEWKDHAEYLAADGKKLEGGAAIIAMAPVQVNYEADLLPYLSTI